MGGAKRFTHINMGCTSAIRLDILDIVTTSSPSLTVRLMTLLTLKTWIGPVGKITPNFCITSDLRKSKITAE